MDEISACLYRLRPGKDTAARRAGMGLGSKYARRSSAPPADYGIQPHRCPCVSLLSFAVVTDSFDPVAHNRAAWDREVDNSNEWTRPVEPEVIARARAGDWSVVLIGYQPVPRGWFPADLAGVEVLCLASGGGQQGPVLSAAGAAVTVLDAQTTASVSMVRADKTNCGRPDPLQRLSHLR